MNPFEMVVLIVAIASVTSVLRARYRVGKGRDGEDVVLHDPDSARMQHEIRNLKDRIAVLERIATDGDRGRELAREIEALRGRE